MAERLSQVDNKWMELVDSSRFFFDDPKPEMISVEAVAHALSHLCRYNGHTKRFYSVAEHCILMADHVESRAGSPRECLTALHHDDTEAVMSDLVRPIKHTMPEFLERESRLDLFFSRQFGTMYPFPAWIKRLDTQILVDERAQVMNPSDNEWGDIDGMPPLGVKTMDVLGRFPSVMRWMFLRRHYKWTSML